jgi:hypothetical protein
MILLIAVRLVVAAIPLAACAAGPMQGLLTQRGSRRGLLVRPSEAVDAVLRVHLA